MSDNVGALDPLIAPPRPAPEADYGKEGGLWYLKVWEWMLAQWQQRPEQIKYAGLGVALLLSIWTLLPGDEKETPKVFTSRDADLKRGRILGDPYARVDRGRVTNAGRVAINAPDGQKMVLEHMSHLEERLGQVERRLTGGAEGSQAVGGAAAAAGGGVSVQAVQGAGASAAPGGGVSSVGPVRLPGGPIAGVASASPSGLPLSMLASPGAMTMAPSKGPAAISFPVQSSSRMPSSEVVLPVGAYVKAKLLTGVEAPEGTPYPALLQLDFGYIVPNQKTLDLKGCFVIAKAQGDLSTERVQMQATKLSCVARDGHMFERDINGFVADANDNSFAVVGNVNSKQDRVATMAFLSSVVEGIGRSIQMAQTSEQVSPEGTSRQILTGNQGRYLAAGGASQAANMVTQWYLKQAQNLLPTINVGSGRDVWIIMNESVALPHQYFQRFSPGDQYGQDYSFVNHLLD